ncbi:MAG: fluoride efflux transporter CrcB [Bacteroidetes bacterium]|nr:MAG: fluoride efflux transporter CrcB [Bacteroidota bacterium]
MKQVLLVFVGGGFGSALRFIIGKYMNSSQTVIPWGTFTVNILGSLLMGIILGFAVKNNSLTQSQMLLFVVGFCGGFTTFSTFAFQNATFLKNGDLMQFALYTIGTFAIGILAVFAGLFIAKSF